MRPRRRPFGLHAKRDEPVWRAVLLGVSQDFTADELRLFQVHKETESSFDRVVVRRKIGPIERITHLEAQGVARAEPTRTDAEFFSFCEGVVPYFGCIFGRE